MASVSEPSPLLHLRILDAFLHVDLHGGDPPSAIWRALVTDLTDEEASQFPISLNRVLPLLAGDRTRLSLASEMVVTFDVHECALVLASLATRLGSVELALAAAQFAAHPGLSPSEASLISEIPSRLALSEREEQSFAIRVNPEASAGDPMARHLQATMWPGRFAHQRPYVYVMTEDSQPAAQLGLLSAIGGQDARIRRIPGKWGNTPPTGWFSGRSVAVAWGPLPTKELSSAGITFSAPQIFAGPLDAGQVSRLVPQIRGQLQLEVPAELTIPEVALQERLLTPELMGLGSLDIRDMAYLGGGSTNVLYRLEEAGHLRAKHVLTRPGGRFWSYAQLVAYRTWHYHRKITHSRRFPAGLVAVLEGLAEATYASQVGLTADARLLRKDNGKWFDAEGGQAVMEEVVMAVDDVFRPFKLGAGHVPDLVSPSAHTSVNPAILGGTPALKAHRIAARSLAEVDKVHGREAVWQAYPDLGETEIEEGVRVGLLVVNQ